MSVSPKSLALLMSVVTLAFGLTSEVSAEFNLNNLKKSSIPQTPRFVYHQKTGELTMGSKVLARGYSGTGKGRDNPAAEGTKNVGPIPAGRYSIGAAYEHDRLGPVVMNLSPVGHNAKGRSHFRIHGNNKKNDASTGCIILPPSVRQQIAKSGIRTLEVVK